MEIIPQILGVFVSLCMAFIAASVGYISHLQYSVNRERFKSEVFEKRYEVYKATDFFLSGVLNKGFDPFLETRQDKFLDAKMRAQFLFEEDINNYLHLLWEHVASLNAVETKKSSAKGKEHERLVNKELEIRLSLRRQLENLPMKFQRYLRLPYLKNPLGRFAERFFKKMSNNK